MLKSNTITQTDKYLITINVFFSLFLGFLRHPHRSLTVDCVYHKSLTVSKKCYKQLQLDLHRRILLILIEFLFISIEIYRFEGETHLFLKREVRWRWVRYLRELSHWSTVWYRLEKEDAHTHLHTNMGKWYLMYIS